MQRCNQIYVKLCKMTHIRGTKTYMRNKHYIKALLYKNLTVWVDRSRILNGGAAAEWRWERRSAHTSADSGGITPRCHLRPWESLLVVSHVQDIKHLMQQYLKKGYLSCADIYRCPLARFYSAKLIKNPQQSNYFPWAADCSDSL